MNDDSIFPVIMAIIFSISIALLTYFLLIHYVIEPELEQSHRELTVLDFYEQPHDRDIFIIGSSHVNEGIDAYLIEDFLQKRHINRSVYVLGINTETPLSKLPELDNLIASRPELVVIGLSYRDLRNRTNIYDDRFALISQRISSGGEYHYLFNDSQLKLLYQSPVENVFYNRKFIISSLNDQFSRIVRKGKDLNREEIFATNFKDPWIHETNLTDTEKIKMANDNTDLDTISEDLNPQKRALLYTVHLLQQNNISVIIVNMPISPYYSNNINESTRHNFFNFLNITGVPWFDFEREYSPDFFTDKEHMNVAGRTDFSPKLAAIIADYVKKGA